LLVVMTAIGGCASSSSAPPSAVAKGSSPGNPPVDPIVTPASLPTYMNDGAADKIVAKISYANAPQRVITMGQLMKPLIESHGLDTLLLLVQLDIAKQYAEDLRVTLSPQEIAAERDATLGKLFEQQDADNDDAIEKAKKLNKPAKEIERLQKKKQDDRNDLLQNFLEKQRISPTELDIILETNAWIRKMAEPDVQAQITDAMLQERFKIRFNERVKVRHIELTNMRDAAEARRRLAAGEPFVQVVREMSKNIKSQVLDGELPPFSREDTRLPDNFKQAAFALKVGEVSETIQTGETYQIIKLESRIMPENVNFEHARDQLRREMTDEAVQKAMGLFRHRIGEAAKVALKIDDPILAQQFQDRTTAAEKRAADHERILEDQRKAAGNNLTTQPTGGGPAPDFNHAAPATTQSSTNPATAAPMPRQAPTTTAPARVSPAASASTSAAGASKPVGATTRPAGSPK
jgi:parvulin-like peptidyl-prolyl isomerase